MHTHTEEKFLPYPPEVIFDLVADIASYPEFLPWCTATRIIESSDNQMIAEMAVGYKSIRETYKSDVRLDRTALTINVTAISGPFKIMINNWRFESDNKGGCTAHFHIEFEFGSWLLQKVIGAFFTEVVGKMVSAFEKRAIQIHGAVEPD